MPGRDGGECIAGDTKIQFFDQQVEPLAIKDIKVLWEFSYDSASSKMAESPSDVLPLSSVGQDGNVDAVAVFPIFRVAGDEHHPLVKIIVKGNSDGEEFALEATEWHPVAVNSQKFVPVCLLREDDEVLTVKGFGKVFVKHFLPMDKNNPTKVYSLALGDEDVLNDYADHIKQVKEARG